MPAAAGARPGPAGGPAAPPAPEVLHDAVRRLRRTALPALGLAMLAVLVAVGLLAVGVRSKPDAPAGGQVVSGDVERVRPFGDDHQIIDVEDGGVVRELVTTDLTVGKGDNVYALLDRDDTVVEVRQQPVILFRSGALLLLFGVIAVVLGLVKLVTVSRLGNQVLRTPLVPIHGRLVAPTQVERSTGALHGFGALGVLVSVVLLRLIGLSSVDRVLATTDPLTLRAGVAKRGVAQLGGGVAMFVPYGVWEPKAVVTARGDIVRIRPRLPGQRRRR